MSKLLAALVLGMLLLAGCSSSEAPDQARPAKPAELIDLNTASMHELEALPGIGEVTARKIIEGRPYERKDQLVSRHLVTEAAYAKFKDAVVARQK